MEICGVFLIVFLNKILLINMNIQNNNGYSISPYGDLKEGQASTIGCGFRSKGETSDSASGMASRWKDWCYKRFNDKDKASDNNLKRTYPGDALGKINDCKRPPDVTDITYSSWDGGENAYSNTGLLGGYLSTECNNSYGKQINDNWRSWGGVYPHTAPNLVHYGADGKWGSENNELQKDNLDYKIYFHPMSPLSIMGAKTFKDLKNLKNITKDEEGWEEKKRTGSNESVVFVNNKDNRATYRPRHVQTSMTSCTHSGTDDQARSVGNFPELFRNKLFFEKKQMSTSLYPSELASQTSPQRTSGNNILGEKEDVAKGGILRGCMRRSRDYDSTNLLHCCIMGKPYDQSNDNRTDEVKYTCPSKYCRSMQMFDKLSGKQKDYANRRRLVRRVGCGATPKFVSNQWNGLQTNDKPCYVMSKQCTNIGRAICGQPISNNPTLETLCDAWAAIQPSIGSKFKKNRCSWFMTDPQQKREVDQLLSKRGPVVSFTDRELFLLKKLNETFNNDACKSVISSIISNRSNELNIKKWCNNPVPCVEKAYGKCLPKDKSSPTPPKVKQSPSPQEIKKCKDKKDDPIECERSGDCIFEFKDKTGKEYKAGDKDVVSYYRKTFKGALLSSEINHYDNNFKGRELVDVLKNNNIHNDSNNDGIGADICGCHLNNDKNDYNKWYKRNKLQWGKKDAKPESIEKGRPPECWLKECTGSNYKDKSPRTKAKCRDVFVCQQKVEVEINNAKSKGIKLPSKQDCTIERKQTKTKMNVGRDAVHHNEANTDFMDKLNEASRVNQIIKTDTDEAIDILDNDGDEGDDSGISTTLIVTIFGIAIGFVVLLLIAREYINK